MKLNKEEKNKLRMRYAIAFIFLLFIEGLIALFVHDKFIRPYVGDVLVVIVLYCAVRSIIPKKCKLLPLYIFIFAAGVECLQYFHLVQFLGLEKNKFMSVLLGSVFDFKDIICYVVGCLLISLYEIVRFGSVYEQ